ncbi:hypothetical protein V5O48_017973, partial [Marasmius crinis-equi]
MQVSQSRENGGGKRASRNVEGFIPKLEAVAVRGKEKEKNQSSQPARNRASNNRRTPNNPAHGSPNSIPSPSPTRLWSLLSLSLDDSPTRPADTTWSERQLTEKSTTNEEHTLIHSIVHSTLLPFATAFPLSNTIPGDLSDTLRPALNNFGARSVNTQNLRLAKGGGSCQKATRVTVSGYAITVAPTSAGVDSSRTSSTPTTRCSWMSPRIVRSLLKDDDILLHTQFQPPCSESILIHRHHTLTILLPIPQRIDPLPRRCNLSLTNSGQQPSHAEYTNDAPGLCLYTLASTPALSPHDEMIPSRTHDQLCPTTLDIPTHLQRVDPSSVKYAPICTECQQVLYAKNTNNPPTTCSHALVWIPTSNPLTSDLFLLQHHTLFILLSTYQEVGTPPALPGRCRILGNVHVCVGISDLSKWRKRRCQLENSSLDVIEDVPDGSQHNYAFWWLHGIPRVSEDVETSKNGRHAGIIDYMENNLEKYEKQSVPNKDNLQRG